MPFFSVNDSDALGKTSRRMPEMVREIYVMVTEKVRESPGTFFQIFGGNSDLTLGTTYTFKYLAVKGLNLNV